MGLFEWLEWLGLVEKTPEQIKKSCEEANEESYISNYIKLRAEEREYKIKHKEAIEYYLKKPVEQATTMELMRCGFSSNHLTQKHLKELIIIDQNSNKFTKNKRCFDVCDNLLGK